MLSRVRLRWAEWFIRSETDSSQEALDDYLAVNRGRWFISVSSFDRFSLCSPAVVADLLTSCVIVQKAANVVVVVLKVF